MTHSDAEQVDELLAELAARGIELRVHGDRLLFRPRSAMSANLAEKARAVKPALLAAVAAGTAGDRPTAAGAVRPMFRFVEDEMVFGDICAGWTPQSWAAELRRKAACCDAHRPDIAEYYRAWAEDIDRRLKRGREPGTGASP